MRAGAEGSLDIVLLASGSSLPGIPTLLTAPMVKFWSTNLHDSRHALACMSSPEPCKCRVLYLEGKGGATVTLTMCSKS